MTLTLGQALAAHREQHPGCDRHCPDYLTIARDHTERRQIRQGPVMAYTRLDVRENPR